MAISRLPNGRLRVQVYDPASRKMVSAAKVLGLSRDEATFPDNKQGRRSAQDIERNAEAILAKATTGPTVNEFRERWLTNSIFHDDWKLGVDGPTAIHNRERTRKFAEKYGHLPMTQVDGAIAAEWIADGRNVSTVQHLRAMWNAAATFKAGSIVESNPWAKLGLKKSKGNKRKKPPSLEQLERMVEIAWDLTTPSFAAYFEFAAVTGARPSELDALRPSDIDFAAKEVRLERQFNTKTRTFIEPKYGPYTATLTERAEDVLRRLPRVQGHGEFLFTTDRGSHWTQSSRTYHWNVVRSAAGFRKDFTLYLATRHFFGWYAMNILGLAPHVIATQLGHQDGGKLVTELYGHPDEQINRALIREAHSQARVTSLTSHKTFHERARIGA